MQVLDVLYEDDDLIAINKPHDLIIYKSYFSRNIKEKSLLAYVEEHCSQKMHVLHRLDRKTGGIILFGKNKETARNFQSEFEKNTIEKTYLAVVRGFTDENGIIDSPIKAEDDKDYKPALTKYKRLQTCELPLAVDRYKSSRYSLIELYPKTGRTHQLRKHMNKINHPIIGDHKYGDRHHNKSFNNNFNRGNLFLMAIGLKFNHPQSGSMIELDCKPSEQWKIILQKFNYEI